MTCKLVIKSILQTMFANTVLLTLLVLFTINYTESKPLRFKRAFSYIANETACTVDHIVYKDGDSIPTDDPCETCRCRPPGFSCVLRECEVKTGCRAIRRIGECCPLYQCGCEHDGKYYRDGDRIPNAESPCYSCYCQGSSITCSLADCKFRFDCEPDYIINECCPRYDHCPPEFDFSTVTVSSTEIPRLTSEFFKNQSSTTLASTTRFSVSPVDSTEFSVTAKPDSSDSNVETSFPEVLNEATSLATNTSEPDKIEVDKSTSSKDILSSSTTSFESVVPYQIIEATTTTTSGVEQSENNLSVSFDKEMTTASVELFNNETVSENKSIYDKTTIIPDLIKTEMNQNTPAQTESEYIAQPSTESSIKEMTTLQTDKAIAEKEVLELATEYTMMTTANDPTLVSETAILTTEVPKEILLKTDENKRTTTSVDLSADLTTPSSVEEVFTLSNEVPSTKQSISTFNLLNDVQEETTQKPAMDSEAPEQDVRLEVNVNGGGDQTNDTLTVTESGSEYNKSSTTIKPEILELTTELNEISTMSYEQN